MQDKEFNKHYKAGLGSLRMEGKAQSGKAKTIRYSALYKELQKIFNLAVNKIN